MPNFAGAMPVSALDLARQSLWLAMWLSLPALGAGAAAGVTVSALSSRLGAQDAVLTQLPRSLAVAAALGGAGAWMATSLVRFTVMVWGQLGGVS